MEDKKLSEHFSLFELTRTDHRGLQDANRTSITPEILKTGIVLCETLLEPIREHFESPLIVHSGFRCEKLNKAIKGSSASQHCKFEACDFHIVGVPLKDIFNWIKASTLSYGQVILEGWSLGNPCWIHISLGLPYREPSKCRQALTFDGKNYIRVA